MYTLVIILIILVNFSSYYIFIYRNRNYIGTSCTWHYIAILVLSDSVIHIGSKQTIPSNMYLKCQRLKFTKSMLL